MTNVFPIPSLNLSPSSSSSSSTALSSSTRTLTSLLLTRQDLHTQCQILEQLLAEHRATADMDYNTSLQSSGWRTTQHEEGRSRYMSKGEEYDYYNFPPPKTPEGLGRTSAIAQPPLSSSFPSISRPKALDIRHLTARTCGDTSEDNADTSSALVTSTMANLQQLAMGLALVEVEIEMVFVRERVRRRIENGGEGWGGRGEEETEERGL